MTNKQANILFIPTSIGGYSAEPQDAPSQYGYYQQLIYASFAREITTKEGVRSLVSQLAGIARRAHFARQTDVVDMVSRVMLCLPLPDSLKSVARYYQVLQPRGPSPRPLIESLLEDASLPLAYRARVLQTLWANYADEGDLKTATMLTVESMRIAADPSVGDLLSTVEGTRQIAIIRSIDGDHTQALAGLEKVFPLVRAIGRHCPAGYYAFLNSLAVELSEVGRISEAQAACAIALASPFAPAYPEWSATRDEIAAKRKAASRSVVAIHRAPEAELAPQAKSQRNAKQVVRFVPGYRASDKDLFQRSTIKIPATAKIALNAVSILDRMLICTGPRAPPTAPEATLT